MRFLSGLCAGLVAVAAVAAPAAAAGTGVIEGKVLDGATGRPVAGVKLTLTTGTTSGEGEVVARSRSDEKGRYRFEELETGEDRYYALDARHEGGLFAGRPVTLPSDTKRAPVVESTLRVWSTTTDPEAIVVRRNNQFVIPGQAGLSVIESVTVMNRSTGAYIGRGSGMVGQDATGASIAFALPAGAEGVQIIDSDLDIPQLVPTDTGFAATVAFPPGETITTFSYAIPGEEETFDLSKPALYPVVEMSIFAARPLEIRSNRLEPDGRETIDGRTYTRWTSVAPLDAGDPLQALAVAQSSASAVPVVAAMGAGTLLLFALFLFAKRRVRKGADEPMAENPPRGRERGERERLIEEVARLDLEHEAGAVPEPLWREERAGLVARLRSLDPSDAR